MRAVRMEVRFEQGQEPKQEVTLPGIEGLMFRSATRPTVYQARRDGFIASWLKPYPDWETFQCDAVTQWERYAKAIGSPVLHSVIVRFINRLEFPLEGFEAERYFTTHPPRPPSLDWKFASFMQQVEYAVPDTSCVVQTVLGRAFDTASELLAFTLDIEVRLREPLTAAERPLGDVLGDMRSLKNKAFFGLLTEQAWRKYE